VAAVGCGQGRAPRREGFLLVLVLEGDDEGLEIVLEGVVATEEVVASEEILALDAALVAALVIVLTFPLAKVAASN